MTPEEKFKITSNEYTDLIIEYNRNPNLLEGFPEATTHIINSRYAIAYVPNSILNNDFIRNYGIAPLPHCYGLLSTKSLESSQVLKLRRLPGFNLRGQGVLVAMIDTGIDYTNPIFKRSDGTSKIVALWDQTIDSADQYPENTFYGTEYTQEQLNQALNSDNPLSIVPSTDDNGHGTMLAGIAVGNEVPASNFSGVVPDSDLIVVKLKPAKAALRDFYVIPPEVPCYQGNDIMWALDYVIRVANRLKRPLAICFGIGTTQGAHDGKGPLSNTISLYADFPGVAISIAAGNEGNANTHFYSAIDPAIGYSTVEMNVGENEHGFTMELWGTAPNSYSIDITSPSGEHIPRIPESLRVNREIRFVFETTVINIDYSLIEIHSAEQLIIMRFRNPTPGIWRFQVYTRGDLRGDFHIWLPISTYITKDTYFIQSNPYTTITSPVIPLHP